MSKWRFRVFTVACDSLTVCGWLRSVCDRSHNVRSHSLCELLIKRRLDILKEVIAQENLTITVRQVKSEENRADVLTRVPKDWLKCVVSNPCVAIASETRISVKRLRALHGIHHFGVDRSLELARSKFGNGVSRRLVQKVVKQCDTCAKFDPSIRDRWSKGRVSSGITWQRLAADITHVGGTPWLTVIDCASRFTIWKSLTKECAGEVMEHLLAIFGTIGPPNQLLTDNGTVFRNNLLVSLLSEWNVEAVLSGAYRPQGNGLVERVHRTIKRMVSRTKSSVPTCVFWYNVTRGARVASPFELVFSATPKMPGICENRIEISRPDNDICDVADNELSGENNPFVVGDQVYLRPMSGRCDVEWSGPHRVSSIRSNVTVEIDGDGVSRHVSHLRRVPHTSRYRGSSSRYRGSDSPTSSSDTESSEDTAGAVTDEDRGANSAEETMPRINVSCDETVRRSRRECGRRIQCRCIGCR